MFISAKTGVAIGAPLGVGPQFVQLATPTGDVIPGVVAVNTDERWYDAYITESGRFQFKDNDFVSHRVLDAQFDVVDVRTGEVIAEVR